MAVQMTDLSLSAEEAAEGVSPLTQEQKYPWGLSISLDEKSLEKLKLDHEDWRIGDIFHLHALAKVVSISENETQDGEKCCISMQIMALGAESEDMENAKQDHEDIDGEPPLDAHGYLRYKK